MQNKKVFLGGTCNGSTWRSQLIPFLKLDYFDPIVDDWNDVAYQKELYERAHCDYCLYVITAKMKGVYSIAEVIDDSNKRPEKTIFCCLEVDGVFDLPLKRSLDAVGKMVVANGGKWCVDLEALVNALNEG